MTGDADSLCRAAALQFLKPGDESLIENVSLCRVSEGLSGAVVHQCTTKHGVFALKRWPPGTAAQRIDEIHHVQRFVGNSLSIIPPLVPWREQETRLTFGDWHFDCSRWLAGHAFDASTDNVIAAVRNGAAAIGQFHRSTAGLGSEIAIAPAVVQRLSRLGELKELIPLALGRSQKLTGSLRLVANHFNQAWRQHHDQSVSRLRPWSARPVPIQWVLRDVHREHVLFEGGRVTAVVDFDAVKRDTVASDLSRWVGSFMEFAADPKTLWNQAFSSYQTSNAISPCEQELAGAIEEASGFISLANWVVWIAGEGRNFPGGMDAVERRVAHLLRISSVRF